MAVNLSPVGGVAAQFFTNNAVPLSGGKLYTYAAGTTTPQVAYTTSQGNIAWTNPIVLDAGGRVPGSGEIWLTDGLIYKFVLKDANDVLIATYDNITGINSNSVAFTNSQEIQTATAGQTVFTLTTMQYQVGTNSLSVFVDGVNQYGPGAQYAYTETSSTVVTFVSGLHVGAEVKFTTTQQQSAGAVAATQVSFTGFKGQVGNVQDLADDDGSDWVGFEQAGAGAVARSAQDKMQDVISVMDFGATGDGVADDTTALIAAIDAASTNGKYVFIPGGKNLRITAPLNTLTANPIRLTGPISAWKRKQETNTGFATITCDGCALVGSFNSGTSTLSFTPQIIPGLHNLVVKAASGALYGAIIQEYFADWSGVHFEGFAYHGIWSAGSTLCNFGPISFYNVGEGRTTNGQPLDSDTFVDGCAVLAVSSCTSGVTGNLTATRTFSGANFGGSTNWDISVENTASTTTSFKGFIGFNQRNSILRYRGYNGIWIAYCDIDIPAPTIEVYATGGVTANDGLPYALVTLNSSPFISDQSATTSPANPNGSVRFLRTTAFSTGTDYWGYAVNLSNKTAFSRAQVAELVLGDYKPDAGSYSITPVAGLGTATNPMGYFDTALRALRFSAGTRFVPSGLSLPLYTSGTVSAGGFVDVDASIFAPATILFDTSKGVYEVDVQIFDGNTGAVFYHGTWKAIRQPLNNNYELRFYKMGSVDNNAPSGGFTVAENGSGPFTLRISNGTAAAYSYTVNGRLVNSCYTTTY